MGTARSHPDVTTIVEPVDLDTPLEAAVVSFCRHPGGFALESTAVHPTYGRHTILGFDPVDVVCVGPGDRDAITTFAERAHSLPRASPPADVPFAAGWVGFIAYEAGITTDRMAAPRREPRLLPDLRFALYDTIVLYEHATRQWFVAGVEWNGHAPVRRPGLRERIACVTDALRTAPQPPAIDVSQPVCAFPEPNLTRDDYLAKVRRAKRYIEAGDVYEVNLTQRFSATTGVPALDIYRRLRLANPAWFSACLAWDDRAILSVSPELYLDLCGQHAITRPIKGTRPRTGDPSTDARLRAELLTSMKDQAELNMIIDLLRNDLGRVARFGSVQVISPGQIEEHPTVFHRVATVVGDLTPDCDWTDLLRATFPGGSITGAPKVRAMQIIEELEPTPRDVYCGAIGYIGLDGSMVLNLAIRTMIQAGRSLHVYTGGAIVADSDPQDEYNETLAKAAGMLRALGHDAFAGTLARQPAEA